MLRDTAASTPGGGSATSWPGCAKARAGAATFDTNGMERSPTSATGTAWADAVAGDAAGSGDALDRASRA